MFDRESRHVEVTMFGETRTVAVQLFGDRAFSVGNVLVGKFPTGSKLHRSQLSLYRRNARPDHPLRGETAAVIDGEEYVANYTLYTHNRNVGRLIGWWDEKWLNDPDVARW
jgi:hypothetical protein